LNLIRSLDFITKCNFEKGSRVWQKADLFTLIVELYRVISKSEQELDAFQVGKNLKLFYSLVDDYTNLDKSSFDKELDRDLGDYYFSVLQASNARKNRITRGEIIAKTLRGEVNWSAIEPSVVSVA
jgi:hypothetical protein